MPMGDAGLTRGPDVAVLLGVAFKLEAVSLGICVWVELHTMPINDWESHLSFLCGLTSSIVNKSACTSILALSLGKE